MQMDEALDLIANADQVDFDKAMDWLKGLSKQREQAARREATIEAVREGLLKALDQIAQDNNLETMKDSDLPVFFRTCDAVADMMLAHTSAKLKEEPTQ